MAAGKRLICSLMILTVLLTLPGCDETTPRYQDVELGGESFRLELALTESQIRRGLMGRKHIGEHSGMLFVFPNMGVRRFWMKDCLVPIDVIFIDGQGWIVAIHAMTPPAPGTPDGDLKLYSSRRPAQFAIELAGGRAAELGLKADTKLDLPLDALKELAN